MIAAPVMPDQLPPFDEAAEAGAIACVLTADNGDAGPMLDKLSLDALYDHRNREIYSALRCLRIDAKPLDLVALAQLLRDTGKTEAAGGLDYLTALPDKAPSPAAFPTFLETVQDRATRRAACRDAAELSRLALDTAIPATAIADASRRMLEAHAANNQDRTGQLLTARIFKPDIRPPQLRPIYTLAGHPVSTPGNMTSINAAVKVGKTAVIGAMQAAALAQSNAGDFLGFASSNPRNLALLHFDSEQSPDDHWHQVTRALKRAGLSAPPPWFYSYCLTGLGYSRAWQCVIAATKTAADKHGGIHSALIDGVADLVADVNDAGESNSFVAELHDMGIHYDCPIVGVIHFNPGGEKTRGHLGSQLERKAETNLRLDKQDEVTTIWSDKQRRAPIPKGTGPCFKWDDAAGMHVSVENLQITKDAAARESLLCLAQDVFKDRPAMRYSELQTTVKKLLSVCDRTAERKVAQMRALTVIKPSTLGFYVINTPACTK